MSVMEMSHRGKEFSGIIKKAEEDLRALLGISDEYAVLFMQGGASLEFAGVPINLSQPGDAADYVVTGSWSKKAAGEAKRFVRVNVAAEGDGKSVPDASTWNLSDEAKYVHYCDNETIGGVEFNHVPDLGADKLLVADMSSNFLSKPVDVSRFGVIYAGAQKNVGPAGVAVVIARRDLLGRARVEGTPSYLDWAKMDKEGSMPNTPPCWSIYICGLVFEHMLAAGGLEAVAQRNAAKAKVLYDAIDGSDGFYAAPVALANRSKMNVPFTIPSKPDLEPVFIKEAQALGMVQLKGHRSVGGMRASIYNSMPLEGVHELAAFMKEFANKHA